MLGDSSRHHSTVAQRNTSVDLPGRAAKYKGRETEVMAGHVVAPISAPRSPFTFSIPPEQKENIASTPTKIRYPTPGSSVYEPPSSGSKRKFHDTDFSQLSEQQLMKRTRPALGEKNGKAPDNSSDVGFGCLDGIKAVIENLDYPKASASVDRPMAPARKPKTRKQTSQVTDPPTPQGFAQFMINSRHVNSAPVSSIDPLQCHESISEPEGYGYGAAIPPTPIEQDMVKVMTPLAYPSTGPSGIATPTRSYYPKNAVDFDKVSENLRKIASTSDFGLMINSEPALALKSILTPLDLPLFDSSFSIWLNDVKAEELLTVKSSPDCLDRHRDITPLSRWVVLNWIRDVCVEHRMSRQSFHSAIQLLDIFLSNFDFDQTNFQLVALTALLVSLKVHETAQYPIAFLVEFVWDEESMTPQENQANIDFAKKFLLKYEFKMMKLLNWNVMLPTPLDFLRHSFQFAALFEGSHYHCDLPDMLFDSRYERGADTVLHQKYDTMMFARAAAIIDRAVMDYHSLNFLGSQIAAAVFWMIYPKRGPRDHQEKVILVATGYSLDQIGECLEFLEPYGNVNDHTIKEILQRDIMVDLLQRLAADDQDFKLEEHQIPGVQMPVDYDNILADRAKKLGKPHVLSHWQFE